MKAAFLGLFLSILAAGQTPAAKPAFEVASIRPGLSGNLNPSQFQSAVQAGTFHQLIDDSRIDLGSVPLLNLILMAYRVPQDRITGPSWIMEPTQRFDVQAKLPAGATKAQVPEMLQTLLEERFKLAVHHDQRVVSVYALTVAKDGPKLQASAADDPSAPACNGGFRKVCRKMTMEGLANLFTRMSEMNVSLEGGIDRPVLDQTGLPGAYDFILEYGRDRGAGGRSGPSVAPAAVPSEGTTRSVFEAVKDLGLKLDSIKHTFDILVVDRVERTPTAN
jgi:uncharacterized protein (TIGR03435 family)